MVRRVRWPASWFGCVMIITVVTFIMYYCVRISREVGRGPVTMADDGWAADA